MVNALRRITAFEYCLYAAQIAVAVFVWSSLTGTDLGHVVAIATDKVGIIIGKL